MRHSILYVVISLHYLFIIWVFILSQKASTTPRNACQALFSVSVIFSSRILDFNMVDIWGPTNFPLFGLTSDNFGNIVLIS